MRDASAKLVDLLRRVAERDRDSFAQLYQLTSLKLFGIIFRILRQRERTEEILQEVYLRIWERASDFDDARASPITWMAAIARNRALDEVRRRSLPTIDADLETLSVADPAQLPSDKIELNEELVRLEACLDQLEANRRDAIKLAYLDGLSRRELADRFKQPVGTIKTWLHRGLKQLKDCLGS